MKKILAIISILFIYSFSSQIYCEIISEGSAIARIISLEKRGILIKSYEGQMEVAAASKDSCEKEECIDKEIISFSFRSDREETAEFITKNLNKQFYVSYVIHHEKPFSIETTLELMDVSGQRNSSLKDLPLFSYTRKHFETTEKFKGKILRIEKEGTGAGGLVYNREKNRIFRFKTEEDDFIRYITRIMQSKKEYTIHIAKDTIFEIKL